jgi:HK97 gp10 family phage protein
MPNVATRGAGYQFEWRGDDVLNSVRNNSLSGMRDLERIARKTMEQRVPVDTGALKKSIFTRVTRVGTMYVLEFGATIFYTVFVELGTSRMHSQPFIRPAADAVKAYAARTFAQQRDPRTGRFV